MTDKQNQIIIPFSKDYFDHFNSRIGKFELLVYDSFMILMDALQNVGEKSSNI